jgi:hypothetical protein
MFQNENEKVITKAKSQEVSKTRLVSTKCSSHAEARSPKVPPDRNDNFIRPLTSTHSLTPTIEERAMGFFFSNLIIGVLGPSQDYLAYVPSLFNRTDMDEHLFASIRAVGIAGFSTVANSPLLMKDARKDYSTALNLVNTALRSPTDVQKDSTLLAVMVLSFFESVTGFNQRSLQAWAQHIHGAAALVKLRGYEQLRSPEGLRLFNQVTASLLMSCVHRELEIPTEILELRTEAGRQIDPSDPAWRLQNILIAFASFRCSLRHGPPSDISSILAAALELDGAFLELFNSVPAAWKYEVISTDSGWENPELVFNGCPNYHVYRDFGVAQSWNSMRSCRILLNRAIRDVLLRGFAAKPPVFVASEHTVLFQAATDMLFQLRDDILASVPQYLGCGGNTPGRSELLDPSSLALSGTISRQSMVKPSDQTPSSRASGGYFLIWPLYLVGAMDITTEPMRLWIIERLQFIGRSEGIQLAVAVAGLLEKKGQVQKWWSNMQS